MSEMFTLSEQSHVSLTFLGITGLQASMLEISSFADQPFSEPFFLQVHSPLHPLASQTSLSPS